MRLRGSDDHVVRYQDETGRGFDQPQSLKLLVGENYALQIELDDIGKSVDGIVGVKLDDEALDILEREVGHSEKFDNPVYKISLQWKLSWMTLIGKGLTPLLALGI